MKREFHHYTVGELKRTAKALRRRVSREAARIRKMSQLQAEIDLLADKRDAMARMSPYERTHNPNLGLTVSASSEYLGNK